MKAITNFEVTYEDAEERRWCANGLNFRARLRPFYHGSTVKIWRVECLMGALTINIGTLAKSSSVLTRELAWLSYNQLKYIKQRINGI